ncbi:MAG: hypothetical protein ABSC37_09095 [Xanthobacteraceae bacterium]|jgi:hypothetical protein
MPGKLDEISFILGEIKSSIQDSNERYKQLQDGIRQLSIAISEHPVTCPARVRFDEFSQNANRRIDALEILQSGFQMTRKKLTILAAIGFAVMVMLGWVVEAAFKWAVTWMLSHFQ